MLNFIRRAVANATKGDHEEIRPPPKTEKFLYGRPYFLGLSKEEVDNSRDFGIRPIFIPRNKPKDKAHTIPFNAGYAECINGGKSDFNEDNSYACILSIKGVKDSAAGGDDQLGPYNSPVWPDNASEPKVTEPHNAKQWLYLEAVFYGVFDGHAGYHTSLIVSRLLHKHLQVKLEACLGHLLHKMDHPTEEDIYNTDISIDDLVTGALEDSFAEMDAQLDRESSSYKIKGGCTALVALFLNDKLYIANAGDCRAVLGQGDTVQPVSRDFNPESERQRLNYLGHCYPELLHEEFCCMEFTRRLNKHDLGKRVLCRKPGMEGWVTKIVTEEDLRFPIVTGEGRKARLMGTIGVTRGLGDFNLRVYDTDIWIKPFLSNKPEVRIIDLSSHEWTEEDVLVIGSDGLWDGVTNEEAVALVRRAIQPTEGDDKDVSQRYTIAAQELVCEARGSFTGRGWRKKNDDQGSFDDITAFVIPIKPAADKWKNRSHSVTKTTTSKHDSQASTSSSEMVGSGCSDETDGGDSVSKTASLSVNKPAKAKKVDQVRQTSIDRGRSTIKKHITVIDVSDKTTEKSCEKIDIDDDQFEVIETTDAAIAAVKEPGSVHKHEDGESRHKTSTADGDQAMAESGSLDTRKSGSSQAGESEQNQRDSKAEDTDQDSGAVEIYKLNPGEDDSNRN